MTRENRIRLSDQEKRLLETLKEMKYSDDPVPLGVVVGDACRAVIGSREAGADADNDSGVHL
jgi:hypothetical protein